MRIVKPIQITDSNLVSSTLAENDYAAYSSSATYSLGQYVIDTTLHKIYQSLRGGSATVTISYASPAVVGWPAHGLTNGTAVNFTTAGTLPTGLVAGTTYYVVNASTDTFNIAATLGGSAINTTSSGSGTFTGHDTPNIGHTPSTSPTWWLDCGATNKWKVFDASVQSQSTAVQTLSFTVFSATVLDTIPLLNISGATTARVQITHSADGTVYDQTATILSDADVVKDWFSYFSTGFRVKRDVIFEKIPPYNNTTITVTLTGPAGATVGIGCAIFGLATDISSTGKGVEYGAKVSITDYSVKTTDAFGNYTILERAFAKRANFTVYVASGDVDLVINLLSDLRATPVVYIGGRSYTSTVIYGYYKNFEVEIAYQDASICTVEVDGLA